jgi:OmpA-OmpF porin, OOP family
MKAFLIASMTILLLFSPAAYKSFAQIDVAGKIKDKANQRANQGVDDGINEAFDDTENGIKNGDKKKDKDKNEANQENKDNENKGDENSQKQPSNETKSTSSPQPLTSYSKFDFIPGEKVIFYEDFMQDAIGDFPALWNTNGSGEVTTTNLYPGNWFKMKSGGVFMPEITIPFNENFTFECDLIFKDNTESNSSEEFDINLVSASPEWKIGDEITNGCSITLIRSEAWAVSWKDGGSFFESARQSYNSPDLTTKLRVSVWAQKQRLRLYLNETKVLDLPRLLPPGITCNTLEFNSYSYEGNNSLMTNVRVAYGAPDTRNKLLTTGKLVTYGITFDVNSDKIKPESYGTLKDIAAVLTENAGVKIKIVGHTDSDGDDAKNLDLSKRRAASVKNELSKTFGIDASRMETDGKGETQPIAPNDSPSNKAQNRRVELIKL